MKKLSAFFKVALIFLRKSALLPDEKSSLFKKIFLLELTTDSV
jgi:hypothetical protein